MERRDDLVNHAFLGDIVSDNNFEKYRQQIRRSLETRPPKTLQQLREEAAKKAQEEKKKEEESVEPSATKEQNQPNEPATWKVNLSEVPQQTDSPLAATSRTQLLNRGIYAVNHPSVKRMVNSAAKIEINAESFDPMSMPADARLDCAVAWFSPQGHKWSDEKVEKLINRRYLSGDETANIGISEVRALRQWLTESDVHLAGRGVEGAQLRWKAETMTPDNMERWELEARRVIAEEGMSEDEEAEIRQQRSQEWNEDPWSMGRRPIQDGFANYDLADILQKP